MSGKIMKNGVDYSAPGAPSSTYTAGDGIDITNNVISVVNPVNKVSIEQQTSVSIPCLYNDDGVLYKLDGTTATLSDVLDLGTFGNSLGEFLYLRYVLEVVSATYKDYDWGEQQHTTDTFSNIEKDTGYSTAYLSEGTLFDTYISTNVTLNNGSKTDVFQFVIGKKNGHLYLCIATNAYGGISSNSYAESMSASFEVQLLGF